MPTPSLSRRGLLVAGAVGLAGACTGSGAQVTPTAAPTVDPDVALLIAARDRELALLAAYRAQVTALPHLADELSRFGDQHLEHLTALGGTPPPVPSPSPVAQHPDSSPAATAARKALAALEQRTAAAHAAAAADASLSLAPLLASLCASESAHAAVL